MTDRNQGFTLIELMIAIALMMILMLMLHSMFINAQALYTRAAQRVSIYSQARITMDIIEQDLLQMRTIGDEDSLHMRSVRPSDFSDPAAPSNEEIYAALEDWDSPDPNATPQIREFLSFTGINTWWDENRGEYVTGPALVVYYLRQRPDAEDGGEGGYLVRRLLQHRTLAEITRIVQGEPADPLVISEDEIASFVYSVRIFCDDQAAFQMGEMNRDFRYATLPEASGDSPNAPWLWLTEPGLGGPPPGQQQQAPQAGANVSPGDAARAFPQPVSLQRVEFGGAWRTATAMDRDFLSIRWNYPAVVVCELTMIDRNLTRSDARTGDGAYRTFSRAVYLPATGPMFGLDPTDLELLSGWMGR
jgi:prepilin-type N-terminal cleavage/methylation domain-containing protein